MREGGASIGREKLDGRVTSVVEELPVVDLPYIFKLKGGNQLDTIDPRLLQAEESFARSWQRHRSVKHQKRGVG